MVRSYHGSSYGIPLKKHLGQHFLRDHSVVHAMLDAVVLTPESNVFEIGCGDGFLTKAILDSPIARLWVFEIDQEWAEYVESAYPDSRMTMINDNILDIDYSRFDENKPWVLLANLPYHITFPILKRMVDHRDVLKEGVVMVQEEVAQKIVAAPGDTTTQSLFFGYYFDWKLLKKIAPGAFMPPPAVFSRLIYFKPKSSLAHIPDEAEFWKFIKLCFRQRRRMLRNNLAQTHYNVNALPEEFAKGRAQEFSFEQFLYLWDLVRIK